MFEVTISVTITADGVAKAACQAERVAKTINDSPRPATAEVTDIELVEDERQV